MGHVQPFVVPGPDPPRLYPAEDPDARPADDGAPGRFRALAEAWQVLGDPGRRAAYDRAHERGQTASGMPVAVPVPVRRARPGGLAGLFPVPGPPLRAGPVRVEGTPGSVSQQPG
jgi:curved DNA-binding protein CbpA